MSEEERVMPFEKAQDVFPMKVTPKWGKGALGYGATNVMRARIASSGMLPNHDNCLA
jgi:hypothetical protein